MSKARRAGHAVAAAVAGMVLALSMPVAANAATAEAAPAACPQPGQRIKTASSPAIYVVDPEFQLRSIQDEKTYFRLWDSWSYVIVDEVESCFADPIPLLDAELVKEPGDPRVYIWDSHFGFRHIIAPDVFAKYGFSWGKITERASVDPNPDKPWYQ
ncbi:hypothetical protein LWC34_55910 [Kibdelosporangium philippinense]|uniref:Lipoprotein n=1 Tax=Kibdelosporangium philippinense TaxID=211113 RepID=A0ABS8ZXU6_9PSEU|nr:hypothetical protein [Kibdelosporangium philippinense]MCE7012040.1 hypothetical protein [Kibdelosporangium philippinense]